MRLVPAFALMSSALALAACGGGGGSLSGGGTLSAAGLRANVNGVCAISDTSCVPASSGGAAAAVDPDGDGISSDLDTDGNTGSGAGGNNTQLDTGLKSLALQKFSWKKPTLGETALSKITSPEFADEAATEAAIMSATGKPTQLLFAVDTNDSNNSKYSAPVVQKEYIYGTRDMRWVELGHTTIDWTLFTSPFTTPIRDVNGNPVTFDAAKDTFVYTVNDPAGNFIMNQSIDIANSFYWDQIKVFMNKKANGGIKDGYREYRAISTVDNRDEVLQVWNWDKSYTVAYGNQIGGGDPKQLVYAIGGDETTDMPTGGSATYLGRWVGTAKTQNWTKPDGADVDPNASWMMQGRSSFAANFGTNEVTGTLTPETWTSYQDKLKAWYTWHTPASSVPVAGDTYAPPFSIGNPSAPEYEFYSVPLNLKGTIVAGNTTVTTVTPAGPVVTPVKNAFSGEANFAGAYVTGDNPFYGSFFGTNASEMTGVFTATGKTLTPLGGSTAQLDARRATVTINGSFNADCTTNSTCAPPPPP